MTDSNPGPLDHKACAQPLCYRCCTVSRYILDSQGVCVLNLDPVLITWGLLVNTFNFLNLLPTGILSKLLMPVDCTVSGNSSLCNYILFRSYL